MSAEEVARCVLRAFDALPAKRKPRLRDDGTREWVPLAGIVLSKGTNGPLTCAALATGMKCLPASKLPLAKGTTLHDWHAEILAIRTFNSFLLHECAAVAQAVAAEEASSSTSSSSSSPTSDEPHDPRNESPRNHSPFIRLRHPSELAATRTHQPFALHDDITIHMYCTEAPCGDASMELIMQSQPDATPWDLPPPPANPQNPSQHPPTILPGRAYFSHLGHPRRKPSRPDAPPTLSLSCTDKLALRQCTSLLLSPTTLLLHPTNTYLSTLTLPHPVLVPAAIERAFGHRTGRFCAYTPGHTWPGGYVFRPFTVRGVGVEEADFAWSRRWRGPGPAAPAPAFVPSNIAAAWAPHWVLEGKGKGDADGAETLIGGVRQGRRAFDPRGASRVSRRRLWGVVGEVVGMLPRGWGAGGGVGLEGVREALARRTYTELKGCGVLRERKGVKEEIRGVGGPLEGWRSGGEDGGWGLDGEGKEGG